MNFLCKSVSDGDSYLSCRLFHWCFVVKLLITQVRIPHVLVYVAVTSALHVSIQFRSNHTLRHHSIYALLGPQCNFMLSCIKCQSELELC